MKSFKILLLCSFVFFFAQHGMSQANAFLNILTINGGQVNVGSTIDLQVSVGNSGPADIGVNKVRAQISIPIAIATALPNVQQTGIPAGWIILTNNGAGITICNGTDIIPAGEQRQIFIKIQGTAVGGPSTIAGALNFGPGTGVCTGPGSLSGDNTADNTSTTSITVLAVAACGISANAAAGTITCNGGTTTLTATASGAAGAVEYSIDGINFQSSNAFIVGAGTYTVTAREVGRPDCRADASPVTITEPSAVAVPVTGAITQPTCAAATGSVNLAGLPAGNWTITAAPGGASITGSGANTNFGGLTGGTYTFTVTNAAGCTSAASATVLINNILVPVLITVSITQPTCLVASGNADVTSGTTGLNFSLDGNSFDPYPAGGYAVATGTHTLVSKNADGCTSPLATFSVDAQPATPAAPVAGAITQPTCTVSTGSVLITSLPTGNWFVNPGSITGNSASTLISGLAPGTYNFTVSNAAGCTSAPSSDILILTVPGAPTAPGVNVVQPSCTVSTGTIAITSGTSGLTFSLDGGTYAPYPAGGYSLPTGTHTLTSQNAGNCVSPVTIITVNPQPATPPTPTIIIAQPTCTVANGLVTVTSSNTGLLFSIDGSGFATYPSAGYDLPGGPHTIVAQNADGCNSPVNNFSVDAQPSSPTGTVVTGTILCNGNSTTITVTAASGLPPYEYNLDGSVFQSSNAFTVVGGTHSIVISDANHCTGTISGITIIEPAPINASATAGNTSPCNSATTSLTVTATGGTGNKEYSINGGPFQSSNVFTVNEAGSPYTVMVRDANNCSTSTNTVNVILPAILSVGLNAARITECGGLTNIIVKGQGGVAPYTGEANFVKGPGTWKFSISDAAGCTAIDSIIIEAPGCLYLNVFPNPVGNLLSINHSVAEPGSRMQVFSVTGSLLISKAVSLNSFFTTIDTRQLASSTYILLFTNGNEKKYAKFIKANSN